MLKYLSLALISLMALGLVGCGSEESTATKSEENSYRNPPKEPPPGAMEGMKKGMENKPADGSGK